MSDPLDLVLLDRRDDGVAVVTLNRPKVNALSSDLIVALAGVLDQLEADLPGAVVLTGGPKLFAAGADIVEFTGGPERAKAMVASFHPQFDRLAALPRVTIAAISGFALGGGLELALACDLRIASDRARLGFPEALLGLFPGGGGTQRVPRLIGLAKARDLIFSGRQVDAAEALGMGLVDEVVEHDLVHDRALSRAAEFAAGPLVALGLAKACLADATDLPLADGLHNEIERFGELFFSDDAGIGVRSFLEHGPGHARFTGR